MSSPSSTTSSGTESQKAVRSGTERDVAFAQRSVKRAPSPKYAELKERRRKIFLNKVRDERDEKRFEVRGDDVCRLSSILFFRNYMRDICILM